MSDAYSLPAWEKQFESFLNSQQEGDSSHGLDHIRRVVASAKRIGLHEGARKEVVIPAAWLHDCVHVEKSSPNRSRASTFAAEMAILHLNEIGYAEEFREDIYHAIQAHSFSAGIPPETREAQVVQDADRLDALGAIGLARCLMVGERLGLPLYNTGDPFNQHREADDSQFIIDHFYVKLFSLPETMQTRSGKEEGQRRVLFLKEFLRQLELELPKE